MIRRLVALVLVLAVAGALFVLLWPSVVGWQREIVVAQAVAFRTGGAVVAAGLIVVLLLLGLVVRGLRPLTSSFAVLLLVFGAVSAGIGASRGLGRETTPEGSAAEITVLAWNTRGGAPGVDAIAQLALDEGAEVVSLPETDAETAAGVVAALAAGGRTFWAHTSSYDDVPGSPPTTLLVDQAVGEYRVDLAEDGTEPRLTPFAPSVVAVPVSGTGPTLVAAHTASPVPQNMDDWRAGLEAVAATCSPPEAPEASDAPATDGAAVDAAAPDAPPAEAPLVDVVVAGDLNATLDHMTGLGTGRGALGDCRDAAVATTNGAVGTWPTAVPALLGAPIDHVMATRQWSTSAFRVVSGLDDLGTDHRPVVAQLVPAGS